jgi:hypothetical protein
MGGRLVLRGRLLVQEAQPRRAGLVRKLSTASGAPILRGRHRPSFAMPLARVLQALFRGDARERLLHAREGERQGRSFILYV